MMLNHENVPDSEPGPIRTPKVPGNGPRRDEDPALEADNVSLSTDSSPESDSVLEYGGELYRQPLERISLFRKTGLPLGWTGFNTFWLKQELGSTKSHFDSFERDLRVKVLSLILDVRLKGEPPPSRPFIDDLREWVSGDDEHLVVRPSVYVDVLLDVADGPAVDVPTLKELKKTLVFDADRIANMKALIDSFGGNVSAVGIASAVSSMVVLYHRVRMVRAVHSLYLFMIIAGFKPHNLNKVLEALRKYYVKAVKLSFVCFYERWLKYTTAYVQAKHLDVFLSYPPPLDELKPNDRHFLTGVFYTYFESGCNKTTRERLFLNNLVTGFKKGQPRYPENLLKDATAKFARSVFGGVRVPPPHVRLGNSNYLVGGKSFSLNVLQQKLESIIGAIVRCMRLKPLEAMPVEVPKPTSRGPSTVDTDGWSRMKGGGFGWFTSLVFRSFFQKGQGRIGSTPIAKFSQGDTTTALYGLVRLNFLETIDEDLVTVVMDCIGKGIPVTPEALPEPLKARLITRCPADVSQLLQYLQRVLHAGLQHIPSFRLTKETPSNGIEQQLNSVVMKFYAPEHYFVSGDYTAATDNLDPWVSYTICQHLAKALGLPYLLKLIFEMGLVGHSLSGTKQTWGQLMGSVVSFPILCIANLAMTLLAFEIAGERRKVLNNGILVNGDDIGFSASLPLIKAWKQVTTIFGLEPSVGKNFLSREFVQLNSKIFEFDAVNMRVKYIPSPSLAVLLVGSDSNGALSLGLNRVIDFAEFVGSASQWQKTFIEGPCAADKLYLNWIWTEVWASYLKDVSDRGHGTVNWYFPRSLGGLGLSWHGCGLPGCNDGQLRAAAYRRDMSTYDSFVSSLSSVGLTSKVNDIHDNSNRVLDELVNKGFLIRNWVDEDAVPDIYSTGSLTDFGDLSREFGKSIGKVISYMGTYRTNFRAGRFHCDVDSSTPSPSVSITYETRGPGDQILLDRVRPLDKLVRLNKQAARSTDRLMNIPDVLSFPEKVLYYVPARGCVVKMGGGLKYWPTSVGQYVGYSGLGSIPDDAVQLIKGLPFVLSHDDTPFSHGI